MAEIGREDAIHPCNGYFLVQESEEDNTHGIIVISEEHIYRSAIIVEMSPDHTEIDVDIEDWEWKIGDLIYFATSLEAGNCMFVHWTDIVAFKRFR